MNRITRKEILRHGLLFLGTFITVTLTGSITYAPGPPPALPEEGFDLAWGWAFFLEGLHFSVPFMAILLVHELGHYFTARRHRVQTSLPYFLPFIPAILGTLGAVISMKGARSTRRQYFDIGIAGPLAGWVLAIGVLVYGYSTLPPAEHIFEIHPEYEAYGLDYPEHVYNTDSVSEDSLATLYFGTNLTMEFFAQVVADPERVPPQEEIMHFPYIMAGFWALFFTALNLLPIGQLDGGHILYGLVGARRQRKVSAVIFLVFVTYAGLGLITPYTPRGELIWQLPLYIFFLFFIFRGLEFEPGNRLIAALAVAAVQYGVGFFFPNIQGFPGWLVFGLLLGRMVGIYHPAAPIDLPLSRSRQILGWIALIIFVLSFTPLPVYTPTP